MLCQNALVVNVLADDLVRRIVRSPRRLRARRQPSGRFIKVVALDQHLQCSIGKLTRVMFDQRRIVERGIKDHGRWVLLFLVPSGRHQKRRRVRALARFRFLSIGSGRLQSMLKRFNSGRHHNFIRVCHANIGSLVDQSRRNLDFSQKHVIVEIFLLLHKRTPVSKS